MEKPAPSRRAASAFLPAIAAASTDSVRRTASRCTRPMKPVPKIAVLICLIVVSLSLPVPQYASMYPNLGPPGSTRTFADHDAIEKNSCLGQSLFWRQQTVLVLDGNDVVVAKHA